MINKFERQSERGMLAIETLISFFGLLILIFFLIVWINVASLQLRMHYALTQSALEISFYTHSLELVGAMDPLRGISEQAAERGEEINELSGNISSIFDQMGKFAGASSSATPQDFSVLIDAVNIAQNNGEEAFEILQGWGDDFGSDPAAFIQGFMWVGANMAVRSALDAFIGNAVAPSFFWRYMGGRASDRIYRVGTASATDLEFIWSGIDAQHGIFQGTKFFHGDSSDAITLSTRYMLDLGAFLSDNPLYSVPQMRVVHQVKTRAWVGDSGRRFEIPGGATSERRVNS